VDFAGIERIRFSAEEKDRRQLARAFALEERIRKLALRAAPHQREMNSVGSAIVV